MSEQPRTFEESYAEYARKMRLWEEGPTTTNFQQLIEKGIRLPEPDSIPDAEIRTKVWEVLAGLDKLGVYLDHTDHLSDRDLYRKLWHEILRVDVPAVDIGFDCVQVLHPGDDADDRTYLKYFADEEWRGHWANDYPDYLIPPREDPPFNRDRLLPYAKGIVGMPEAEGWLQANWGESAFATNRFGKTEDALKFVQQLYEAGATEIGIDNVMMLPNHDWTPYADTLIVELPKEPAQRRKLFELMKEVGQPDEDGGKPVDQLLLDSGQSSVRLWWD